MERWRCEQVFHDRQARERAADHRRRGRSLVFNDDDYLDHETWIRPALMKLGDIRGRLLLDLGCGHGMAAIVMARRGARVVALDLSHGYLEEASRRAAANGVGIDFVKADGERLPFANESFDAVWGSAILHHLELVSAGHEVRRVLRPGGIAVFCEPWGGNPLLGWARRSLPYPEKGRTPDEQPLDRAAVQQLRSCFASVQVEGSQLLGMARRVVKAPALLAGLDWCDRQLLARVPRLENYCRYAIIILRRSESD